MKQFKTISPIGDGDTNAIPVRDLGPAIKFYTEVLGFSLATLDEKSAVLRRDDVEIGLIPKSDHDPKRAGSFYLGVVDLEALRGEFQGRGARPGAIEKQQHEGKTYRLFFLSNGKIGTWGGSAGAITQFQMVKSGTDKISAQHLTVGAPNLYDVGYVNGVFRKALIEDWLRLAQWSSNALPRWVGDPTHDD